MVNDAPTPHKYPWGDAIIVCLWVMPHVRSQHPNHPQIPIKTEDTIEDMHRISSASIACVVRASSSHPE